MIVEEPHYPAWRVSLGEVLVHQLAHRGRESRRIRGDLEGIAIGQALAPAREPIYQRERGQRKENPHQGHQGHCGKIVNAREPEAHHTPLQGQMRDIEGRKGREGLNRDAEFQVVADLVPKLVGEDGLDLIRGVGFVERVAQGNAFGGSQTHNERWLRWCVH